MCFLDVVLKSSHSRNLNGGYTVIMVTVVIVDHDALDLSSTQVQLGSMPLKRRDLTSWMGKLSTPSALFLKE